MNYLSYLMGADNFSQNDLEKIGISIKENEGGVFKIEIPDDSLNQYASLIKEKLNLGFWNEIIGRDKIIFVFKFKDGVIKEFILSPETEGEIDKLCAEFNSESPDKNPNVYKYLSENDFYHEFMLENYLKEINR